MPSGNECPVVPGKRRFYLRYDRKAVRLAKRRAQEETAEFRDRYRFRAGMEGTISAYAARTGVTQLRVRGLEAVRFCATLKATGVNIFRAALVRKALMEAPETLAEKNLAYVTLISFSKSYEAPFGGGYNDLCPQWVPTKFLNPFLLVDFLRDYQYYSLFSNGLFG